MFALAVIVSTMTQAAAGETIAVMPLAGQGVAQETTTILDDLLVAAVDDAGEHKVISPRDINAMLGLEKMKESLGCTELACAAELGGALGARYLLFGSVSRLGGQVIVSLTLLDAQAQEAKARAKAQAPDLEARYGEAIDAAVAELFGLAKPAPLPAASLAAAAPARTPGPLPIALWAGGGVALGLGAWFGLSAESHERRVDDKELGSQLDAERALEKGRLANLSFGVGAAAVAAGFLTWLLQSDDEPAALAVVPGREPAVVARVRF